MRKAGYFGIGMIFGAAISGLSTYFYMKHWAGKQIAFQVDSFKKAHHVREKYPHFDDIPGGEIVSRDGTEDGKSDSGEFHSGFLKSSLSEGPVEVGERVAYHKMAKNYMKGESDISSSDGSNASVDPAESIGPEEDGPADEDRVPAGEIALITDEEYQEEMSHSKVECQWHAEDDVICDNYNEIIEEREMLFGSCLDDVDISQATGDEMFYIRNNKVCVDYCIEVILDSYQE